MSESGPWPPPQAPGTQPAPTSPGVPGTWGPPRPVAPSRAPRLPVEPRDYMRFWRAPGIPIWKPILAVILGVVGFFVISTAVIIVGFLVEGFRDPAGIEDVMNGLLEGDVTPVLFVANSASLGLMIVLALLLGRLVGQPARYIHSVEGRVRWGWLGRALLVSLVGVAIYVLGSQTLEGWDSLDLRVNDDTWWFLIAVMLVTPFQAAGEEYLVRGVLGRAVASIIPSRGVGLALSALATSTVFMFLHGAGDLWLNIIYFTMGLLFWWITWRTGGLEVAVALHVANNMLALALVPFMDLDGVFDRSAGVGSPWMLVQVVILGAVALWLDRKARRGGVVAHAAPGSAGGPG